jgi:hypothetical protein
MFRHPAFATTKEFAIVLNIVPSDGTELIAKLCKRGRVIWIGNSNIDHALSFLEAVCLA